MGSIGRIHHTPKGLYSLSPGLPTSSHSAFVQIPLWGDAASQEHNLASGTQDRFQPPLVLSARCSCAVNNLPNNREQLRLSPSIPAFIRGRGRDLVKEGGAQGDQKLTSQEHSYLLICHNGDVEARHSQWAANGIQGVPKGGGKENFTKDMQWTCI